MPTRESYDHDVRTLMPGEVVEVYVESRRSWAAGVFEINTRGRAYVELPDRVTIGLASAMLMGLRRRNPS